MLQSNIGQTFFIVSIFIPPPLSIPSNYLNSQESIWEDIFPEGKYV